MEAYSVDGNGNPIPVYLEEAFDGRNAIYEWVKEMARLKHLIAIHSREKYGCEIDLQGIQNHLEAARTLALRAAPFARCGCQFGRECEFCGGKKWVSVDNARPSHSDLVRQFDTDSHPRQTAIWGSGAGSGDAGGQGEVGDSGQGGDGRETGTGAKQSEDTSDRPIDATQVGCGQYPSAAAGDFGASGASSEAAEVG